MTASTATTHSRCAHFLCYAQQDDSILTHNVHISWFMSRVSSPCRRMWIYNSSWLETPLRHLRVKGGSACVQTWPALGYPTCSLSPSSFAFASSLKSSFPQTFQGWDSKDWLSKWVNLGLFVLLNQTGCNYSVVVLPVWKGWCLAAKGGERREHRMGSEWLHP